MEKPTMEAINKLAEDNYIANRMRGILREMRIISDQMQEQGRLEAAKLMCQSQSYGVKAMLVIGDEYGFDMKAAAPAKKLPPS